MLLPKLVASGESQIDLPERYLRLIDLAASVTVTETRVAFDLQKVMADIKV
jgi:hypothetical protein